jgi:hypothetical protein
MKNRKQTVYSNKIFHDKCCTVAITTYSLVQGHVWSINSMLSCTLTITTIVTKDYQWALSIHFIPVHLTGISLRLTLFMI